MSVTAINHLQIARPVETIELTADKLDALGTDLNRIHVRDSAGAEVLCQAIDSDYDKYHRPDLLIFQAAFDAGETKTFTLSMGEAHTYSKEQFRAFGRFVRERFDDFAWENDRIAHRTYGKALETWEGEPLSSSTIDIWSKRTSRMVINDWYLTDHYHTDTGEGADFYSAGASRGDGGNGLWAGDRLWVSRNFVDSRVLANGPIRVLFELVYEPFDVNGVSVSEVKRVTLDAGRQLDQYQSFYHPFTRPGQAAALTMGVGLKKVSGEQREFSPEGGWLIKWERMEKNAGNQGLALIVDPRALGRQAEDNLNILLLSRVPESNVGSYWAGFCWDKAGIITTQDAWKKHVDEFAQALRSPIEVTLARH